MGTVMVEGGRLWDLLKSLDDPEHLEFPAGYDHAEIRNRFDQPADRLGTTAFSCACQADRHVEDASYHGRIEIPALATATRSRLVIVVSNSGGLAVVAVDNPGVWIRQGFTELLHPDDAERIYTALDDLGYIVVPGGTAMAAIRRERPAPALEPRAPAHLVDPVLRLPVTLLMAILGREYTGPPESGPLARS
jgi:hypothetical protein